MSCYFPINLLYYCLTNISSIENNLVVNLKPFWRCLFKDFFEGFPVILLIFSSFGFLESRYCTCFLNCCPFYNIANATLFFSLVSSLVNLTKKASRGQRLEWWIYYSRNTNVQVKIHLKTREVNSLLVVKSGERNSTRRLEENIQLFGPKQRMSISRGLMHAKIGVRTLFQ